MIAAVLAGVLAGYGIAIPVGAVGAYLVALSARSGLRVGVAAAFGIATADGGYALVAVLGGAAITDALRPALGAVHWIAGFLLLGLAFRGAVAAWRAHRSAATVPGAAPWSDRATTALRAYGTLLGVTLLNPMTVLYFAALIVGGRVAAHLDPPRAAGFVLAAFVASASWQLLLAGGGAALGRVLTGPRGRLVTAAVSAAAIAALGLHTLPLAEYL